MEAGSYFIRFSYLPFLSDTWDGGSEITGGLNVKSAVDPLEIANASFTAALFMKKGRLKN